MKTSTLATRLAMAAILLTVLLYFGIHAAIYVMGMDPYTTSLAYAFTCDDAVTVNGYVVRREQVLPGGGELAQAAGADLSALGLAGLLRNLIPVTIGNVIGGCGFGALIWAVHRTAEG